MFYIFPTIFLLSLSVETTRVKEFDYIIVGSGAAGSVLANRLSKDPWNKVLLLEAGEEPVLANDIISLSLQLVKSRFDWNFTSIPSKKVGWALRNRQFIATAGKVLGGTAMLNAGVYIRGNKYDYDNWALHGAVGWDWRNVFPYFLKMEDNRDESFVRNGYHGVGGELIVQTPEFLSPAVKAYIEAAESIGYPLGDYNGKSQTVFMPNQGTVNKGRRWTSLRAFIDPIIGRRNFRLITSAFVTKILINEHNQAYGVLFDHKGRQLTALAKKEVIISAGTFNSPKLLMLSGIGPKEELQKLHVPLVADLPVGQNLHDHATTLSLQFLIDSYTFADHRITKEDYNEILVNGTGPLSTLAELEVAGFVNTKYNKYLDWPDMHIVWLTNIIENVLSNANDEVILFFLSLNIYSRYFDQYKDHDIITCFPIVIHPRSRGSVTLKSNNPYVDPVIDLNTLSHPDDVKILVEGMKYCLTLAATKPMRKLGVKPLPYDMPGCEKYERFSDEHLACMALAFPVSVHHFSGTCKMGDPNDPTTVVDATLKVKGVHGLRVVDASIIPILIGGHTMTVTMMIADKAADMILHLGSGAAGSVLANRLSEDVWNKVLLLEAGEEPALANDIISLGLSEINSKYDWNFTSIPSEKVGWALKNREFVATAGKVLGGTAMLTTGVYARGNKYDYDNWALHGAVGWDWRNVFPYFLKMEDNRDESFVRNGYHGVGGELIVQTPEFLSPAVKAYIEAAKSIGYPLGDYNGKSQTVFMPNQGTVNKGRRWTSLRAFIDPIIGRRNFRLITSAFVTKILINEHNQAYGVLFDHKGHQLTALAKKEVIISAGTFNSPKLLMLSGIGPKEELQKLHIPLVADLPVGQNLHDHASTRSLQFLIDSYTFADHRITKEDYNEILVNGTGPLSTLAEIEVAGFVNTKFNKYPDWPDMHIMWLTNRVEKELSNAIDKLQSMFDQYKDHDIITCFPTVIHPRSRGSVTLKSTNPYVEPVIDLNILSHSDDVKILVEGMKYCLTLASTKPMKKLGVRPLPYVMPGCEKYKHFSDEYLTCMALAFPFSVQYFSGTCKMGDPNDPTTVVDASLKVKGVHRLRVVDASIIPIIIGGHTMSVTMMIADKAADMILHQFEK
ncbi:uncharacterized protein LOC111639101 [Centruroides sculpturatus]|uniref:uncharacterized protein LOC111639101 n=1 Tax=Centruroides sculpturatus TaxID=218467 RepID=UPI000C6D7974|nr:uncharacterized protein LOC111639101 [Centruroides sculpturatus]